MKKPDMGFSDYLKETYRVMTKRGVLLVTSSPTGKPNAMTIGWGSAGIIWGKPVFVVLVRPSRYTFECLERTPEFTVNVPTPDMQKVTAFCGTRSGRDVDKFAHLGLRAIPSEHVAPPIIAQCALHYECRVVYSNDVVPDALVKQIVTGSYAQGDFHRLFFGEIVRARYDPDKIESLRK